MNSTPYQEMITALLELDNLELYVKNYKEEVKTLYRFISITPSEDEQRYHSRKVKTIGAAIKGKLNNLEVMLKPILY